MHVLVFAFVRVGLSFSMTGTDAGTVMELVQRHIGCGAPFDYSLPSITLRRVHRKITDTIQHDKERWNELAEQGSPT